MKQVIRALLKRIFWKVIKRDFVLGPDSYIVGQSGNYVIVGKGTPTNHTQFLPVRYTYHTPLNWKLRYDIRGNDCGVLRYMLSAPKSGPFCEAVLNVRLPCTWTLELDDQGLIGNGIRIPGIPGKPIPRETPWLVGELEFRSGENTALWRRTGHRVRLESKAADAEYFNGWIYGSYDEESTHYPGQILELISKYHPPTGRLLDVGCATGLLVEHALTQGLEAEGIDSSPWAVEKANARSHGHCRLLDFEKAELSDFPSAYDIITLHSVLEHLRNPEQVLHLLYALCRPGGVIYIQTLNADSLMHRIMARDWGGYTDHTHQSSWITADWLAETSRHVGFEIAYLRRHYLWNDNVYDTVWQSFASLVQLYPASVMLEDQFGDALQVILRRPGQRATYVDIASSL